MAILLVYEYLVFFGFEATTINNHARIKRTPIYLNKKEKFKIDLGPTRCYPNHGNKW
jgi:hypothetical protein